MVEVVCRLHEPGQELRAPPATEAKHLLLDLIGWSPPRPAPLTRRNAAFPYRPFVFVAFGTCPSLDAERGFAAWSRWRPVIRPRFPLRRARWSPGAEPALGLPVPRRPLCSSPRVVLARPGHSGRVSGPLRDKAPRRATHIDGLRGGACRKKVRRRPTLPGGHPPSTIGADGLHCRVRNGNGCFPAAVATGTSHGSQTTVENPRASTSQEQEDPKPSAD
jgi:hypothetical protein